MQYYLEQHMLQRSGRDSAQSDSTVKAYNCAACVRPGKLKLTGVQSVKKYMLKDTKETKNQNLQNPDTKKLKAHSQGCFESASKIRHSFVKGEKKIK